MTFLEHVIRKYIGPPRGGYWKCPYCDRRNPSVLVNAPKAGCKVKWRCVAAGCPVSGKPRDEYDLLRIYHPDTRYPEQRAMVADLRRVGSSRRSCRVWRVGHARRCRRLSFFPTGT